jgi:NitT/TauT family transport system ATP-binding protein/sulfonate transport system ATP-binding protein
MGNVEFGPKVRGISKAERRKQAQYYIDLVGLNGFENHFPSMLSGGMCQRVGIARAYCNDPQIILMDEPFGHLDAQTRYMMEEEVEKIWAKEKRTIIFVTNNIEEALYLADRIVILSTCPATIQKEYALDMRRPRNMVSPEFLGLREEISALVELREGIKHEQG